MNKGGIMSRQPPQPPYQPPYQPHPPQQLIRTYKPGFGGSPDKKFEEDAEKLLREGWLVHTLSASGSNPIDFKPTFIIVVYRR